MVVLIAAARRPRWHLSPTVTMMPRGSDSSTSDCSSQSCTGRSTTRAVGAGALAILVALTGSCSDAGNDSPDVAICEAISSVRPDSTRGEAQAAADKIRDAGRPQDEQLRDVQEHIDTVDNQLVLSIVSFDDLAQTCENAGAEVDLPPDS